MKRFPTTTTLHVLIYLLAAQVLTPLAPGQGATMQQSVNKEDLAAQEAQIAQLVKKIKDKDIDEDSKTALKQELNALLLEQFTLLESIRREQIETIERRIEQVKATLDMRSKNAETIVASRVSQLLDEPSNIDWNFTLPLNDLPPLLSTVPNTEPKSPSVVLPLLGPNEVKLDGLLTPAKPLNKSVEGNHRTDLNSDLLLGYGLALSNIDGKKKELAEVVKKRDAIEDQMRIARETSYKFSKALEGENRNDPTLNSQYEKTIEDVASKMEQYEKLMSLISQKNREIAILEMRLLPLVEEVNKAYPPDSTKSKPLLELQGLGNPKTDNASEIR